MHFPEGIPYSKRIETEKISWTQKETFFSDENDKLILGISQQKLLSDADKKNFTIRIFGTFQGNYKMTFLS